MQQNKWIVSVKGFAEHQQVKTRFLMVGVFNTLFGLSSYPILYFFISTNVHYLLILSISQSLNITFAYLTNKFIVFKTKGNYKKEISRFLTFHLSYFLLNLAALPISVESFGIHPIFAQTSFAVLVLVLSYFWQSRITFNEKGY